jgi:hypothetical protein
LDTLPKIGRKFLSNLRKFASAARLVGIFVLSYTAFALVLARPRLAHAASTRVVMLMAAADTAEGALDIQIRAALEGQLRELAVELVAVASEQLPLSTTARRAPKIASAAGAFGVIWLERKPRGVRIYLYDASGQHLYVRDAESGGSEASVAEEVAIVLRSAIGALLEGNMTGMTEVQLPPTPRAITQSPPSELPQPATPEMPSLRLGAAYVGTLFFRNAAFQHGVAGAIAVGFPQTPFFAGLGYTYFPALTVSNGGTASQVRRHPIDGFAGAELRFNPLYVTAEAAFIGDAVVRTTEITAPGLTATPPTTRWIWALSTRLSCAFPLRSRLRLKLGVGAEFLLNRYDQVIDGPSVHPDVAASPLLARPRVEAGLVLGI